MTSSYFHIRYDEADASFARRIAAKADQVYTDICQRFGFDSGTGDQKILLTICESVPRYLEVTGKSPEDYQEWMVGHSDFVHRRITLLSPRVSTTHSAQELEKVLVHEMVHMIFDTCTGGADAPLWCAEGIAILYADQIEPDYVDEGHHPKIGELLDEETFADCGGYDYAGVYVWYFMERFGFAKFLELYRNAPGSLGLIHAGFELDAIRKIRERNS